MAESDIKTKLAEGGVIVAEEIMALVNHAADVEAELKKLKQEIVSTGIRTKGGSVGFDTDAQGGWLGFYQVYLPAITKVVKEAEDARPPI